MALERPQNGWDNAWRYQSPRLDLSLAAAEIMSERRLGEAQAKIGAVVYKASGYLEREAWRCPSSPTGAHHWDIERHRGTCRYCREEREFRWNRRSDLKWQGW